MNKVTKVISLVFLSISLLAITATFLIKNKVIDLSVLEPNILPQTETKPEFTESPVIIPESPVVIPEKREIKNFDDFKARVVELKDKTVTNFGLFADHLRVNRKKYLFAMICMFTLVAIISIISLSSSARQELATLSAPGADPNLHAAKDSSTLVQMFGWQPFYIHPLFVFGAIYAVVSIALIFTDMVLTGPTRASSVLFSSPLLSLLIFGLLFLMFMPTLVFCFLFASLFVFLLLNVAKFYKKDHHVVIRFFMKTACILLYLLALPFLIILLVFSAIKYAYCALIQLISFFRAGLRMDKEGDTVRTLYNNIVGLSRATFAFLYSNDTKPLADYQEGIHDIIPFRKRQLSDVFSQ